MLKLGIFDLLSFGGAFWREIIPIRSASKNRPAFVWEQECRVAEQPWKQFAKQIEEQGNPGRIAELAKGLNEAMLAEEREKVRNRLRMPAENRQRINSKRVNQ